VSVVEIYPRLASSNDLGKRDRPRGQFGSLVVILAGSIVERCEITRSRIYIGRGANADLRLNSQYVSVNHAMVSAEESEVSIIDLHSTNKTIVNGRAVRKKALRHGDMIVLGEFTLRYEAPSKLTALNSAKTTETADTGTSPAPALGDAGNETGTASPNEMSGWDADTATSGSRTMLMRRIDGAETEEAPPDSTTTETSSARLPALTIEPEKPAVARPLTPEAPRNAGPSRIEAPTALAAPPRIDPPLRAEPPAPTAQMPVRAAEPPAEIRPQTEESARRRASSPRTQKPPKIEPPKSEGEPQSPTPPPVPSRPAAVSSPAAATTGTLDDAALAVALAEAAREGRAPLEVLETTSGLDAGTLAAELARIFAYPYLSARDLMLLDADFELLPAAEARRRACLVVRAKQGLTAVIADPFDADLRPWLESRVSSPLRWVLAARGDVNAYLSKHEQSVRAIDTALKGAHSELTKDSDVEELSLASINRDSSPVVKLVRSTLYDALRANASDVHLEAGNARLEIRYRLDGVLVPIATVPGTDIAEQVVSRIKVMSELDIAERRVPQDGRFKSSFNDRAIDFRVSIMPSTYGEDAVLRVLDKQAITDQMSELRIDGLGFDLSIVTSLRQLSALPHGMLLVTGPTGSGKTTTLYAAISETNTGMDKIVTIEDPVEYQLPGVLQIPVNEKKGLTFARGLRSILRHDPDKIMVGEIRDPETAQIAVQSALTGHLVFTTVHANNVFDVLSRFTHMGVDVYSFTAALNGILAQRLVRIICEICSERVQPTEEMLKATGLPTEEARAFDWHVGRGCSHCRGTGYRGRRALGELLVLNDEIREAIVARAPVRQLKELAFKNRVRLIRNVALDLLSQGLTTIEEVNRVTAVS
jgi:general secretion pathway protein E